MARAAHRYVHRAGWLTVAVGLLWTLATAGQESVGPYEVGQRWVYEHQGPRPGSMEPNAIDGQRILHVVGVVGQADAERWVIEERFTNSTAVIGRLHVNAARMLTGFDIVNDKGEVATLYYDPPVPYQIAEMDVGGTKTIETTLRMKSSEFALPSTLVMERLEDETIATSTREFAGCLHYKVTHRSTFNIKIAKIPLTEERERWYHADVNGLVKEVYRKGPVKFLTWSRDGYTATSVLTAFDRAPVDDRAALSPPIAGDDTDPRRGTPHLNRLFSAAVPVLAALALAGCVLIRRSRSKRTPQEGPPRP